MSIVALIVGSLACACIAQEIQVGLVPETLVKSRLESGVVPASKRQERIRSLFSDAGCSAEEQAIHKSSANVICTLPGETASAIVIGGHFDFAEEGQGIVDDWSGASLLPSLYQALKVLPRHHTYIFVAFAGEERGLLGSARYVKKLSREDKAHVRAFINLECLGLDSVKIWVSRSTPALVERLVEVAAATHMTLKRVDVDNVGDDDTHPFLWANIPVITIHSVTQNTYSILHSGSDRLKAIHFDDYYNTYKLAAFYLAYLDAKGE